jgi:rhodanese-related sulfurtransferase
MNMTMKIWQRITQVAQAIILVLPMSCAQSIPADKPDLKNADYDARLQRLLSFSTPLIGVETLHEKLNDVYLLDTRSREEFEVSHIEGARYLGYRNLEESALEGVPKEAEIVLYCSVGYRSEKIGNRLRDMGYTNVTNLYGSIFEWVNHGYPVVTPTGTATDSLHTYNQNWSKWVNEPTIKKIW